jgi:hypothetical protein
MDRMKQTLLVALASAAVGAATALFLARPEPVPARSGSSSPRVDAAILQEAMVRALETVGFGRRARTSPVEQPVASPAAASAERPAPAVERSRESGAPELLPPPDFRALQELTSFEDDDRTRRGWLFLSEREVIARLGAPNEVYVNTSGAETWNWKLADGTAVIAWFHNGRLLRIDK